MRTAARFSLSRTRPTVLGYRIPSGHQNALPPSTFKLQASCTVPDYSLALWRYWRSKRKLGQSEPKEASSGHVLSVRRISRHPPPRFVHAEMYYTTVRMTSIHARHLSTKQLDWNIHVHYPPSRLTTLADVKSGLSLVSDSPSAVSGLTFSSLVPFEHDNEVPPTKLSQPCESDHVRMCDGLLC